MKFISDKLKLNIPPFPKNEMNIHHYISNSQLLLY